MLNKMTGNIPFTTLVRNLPASVPFVGPEALERQNNRALEIRIGANESAFGISPKAAEAMRAEVDRISWYADPEGHDLKLEIASRYGIDMHEVCLGGGVDELLGLVVRMVVEPGTPVVTSLGAYPTFNYHVEGFGGILHKVPYLNDHIDLQQLSDTVKRLNAPLVYLANPDNPMGTWHDARAVRNFIDALPDNCVLVLDEAYIEFGPPGVDFAIDVDDPRVIRMRTFSKAHGMAGARVGYAMGERTLIESFNKVRNHFGMNRLSIAGALASLRDESFIHSVIEQVENGRQHYYRLAEECGLKTLPSATNFVAIDIGSGDAARALLSALLERDVFVRMPGVPPLDRCIRVTVGTDEQRNRFAQVLPHALKAIGNVR